MRNFFLSLICFFFLQKCPNCQGFPTWEECSGQSSCGWCEGNNKCVEGDPVGPYDLAKCGLPYYYWPPGKKTNKLKKKTKTKENKAKPQTKEKKPNENENKEKKKTNTKTTNKRKKRKRQRKREKNDL